jgi:diguanylate cyclase
MLWNRKGKASNSGTAPVSIEEDHAAEPAEKSLDVLSTLLRLYGKYAFDTDTAEATQTAAECDSWATRIALGSSRADAAQNGSGRDWPGLIGFVQEQRRSESDYVVRSMRSFREAILCFADCLGKTLGEEQKVDALIEARLGTLSKALQTRDPLLICAEAQVVVDTVKSSIDARRKREVEQSRALGERLKGLREELAEARKKAEVDALTQLSNRAAFDAHLANLASLGKLLGEAPCLMLADLDHFKSINDNYGHPAGDEVLRQVSRCLSRTFLRKHDFVSRYGGEEFAAVLIDTTLAQGEMLAKRLVNNIRALSIVITPHEIRPTISIGLAALRPGESCTSWLERADAALYRAKRAGRDRHEVAAAEPEAGTATRG